MSDQISCRFFLKIHRRINEYSIDKSRSSCLDIAVKVYKLLKLPQCRSEIYPDNYRRIGTQINHI